MLREVYVISHTRVFFWDIVIFQTLLAEMGKNYIMYTHFQKLDKYWKILGSGGTEIIFPQNECFISGWLGVNFSNPNM